MADSTTDWLTPQEAADVVGLSGRHMLAAADCGHLPFWQFGKAVLFRRAEVEHSGPSPTVQPRCWMGM